jgi:potassium large conductance calcium-activated channel subfamily M alpha protein 1
VGSRFIIISGNLTYRTVQDFLSEFYHPIHNQDMDAFPLRIVLMAPYKPSFELKTLMTFYRDRVEFIQGTPVKDSDLDRVSAKVATAFYLLADQLAKDPDAEDAAQIVRTLAVHRHCGSQVRVIVELLKPEKAASAIWDDTDQGIEIICLEVIRFKLLARR